jgi:hypothetical protein
VTEVDRYIVLNIIGKGFSGLVVECLDSECLDSETEKRVAIKVPFERSSDFAEVNILGLLSWPVSRSDMIFFSN